MTNAIQAAAAALILLATPLCAQAAAPDASLRIAFDAADLATTAGHARVQGQIAAATTAFCHAHPADQTVQACRRNLAAELSAKVAARAAAASGAPAPSRRG